jgi:ABC-type amino acid transport substrate-binding protein
MRLQLRWAWWGLPVWLILQSAAACADTVIHYPRPETGADHLSQYPLRLLQQALHGAERDYRVELYPVRMQQARALLRLENSEGIDVVTTMTSAEREARLQPIRIPLDKGVWGLRLLLINKASAGKFAAIASAAQLKPLLAGQGSNWPDTAILRGNGMRVYGAPAGYEVLYRMLETGNIDYFPRSVTEIWGEHQLHRDALMIEPALVLRYRTAVYFFVRKSDTRLAADLQNGLERMLADGSFEKLFQKFFGEQIRRAALKDRRVIDLVNPTAPALPLERRELWFY